MELIEGEDLAQRLARGPVPVTEALAIARQVADALEAAHERGVVHRDLKPANIKVRPDGTVKVLDFGLAKAIDGPGDSSPRESATITRADLTQQGAMLGTVAYMSPEQINGRPATRRSDIWAFGCVLFELLTGRAPFAGRTASDILANVLKSEPDWPGLPGETPEPIRRLLRRALAKDDRERLHDIADARLEIDDARGGVIADSSGPLPSLSRRERLAWLAGRGPVGGRGRRPGAPGTSDDTSGEVGGRPHDPSRSSTHRTSRRSRCPPTARRWWRRASSTGARSCSCAGSTRRRRAHCLARSAECIRSGPRTDAPSDSSLDGYLRRLDVDAGLVRPLTKATVGVGGSWNADGAILFAPTPASPIFRTSSDGAPAGHCDDIRRRTRRARLPPLPAGWPPLPLLRRRQSGRPRRLRRSARRIGGDPSVRCRCARRLHGGAADLRPQRHALRPAVRRGAARAARQPIPDSGRRHGQYRLLRHGLGRCRDRRIPRRLGPATATVRPGRPQRPRARTARRTR